MSSSKNKVGIQKDSYNILLIALFSKSVSKKKTSLHVAENNGLFLFCFRNSLQEDSPKNAVVKQLLRDLRNDFTKVSY